MNIEIIRFIRQNIFPTMINKSSAFQKGFNEYLLGHSLVKNPYKSPSSYSDAWEYGFLTAEKAYEELQTEALSF